MIALIEIEEEQLHSVAVPFVLYGVYKKGASIKLKAAFLKLWDLKKQMSNLHKEIENLQEYESE